MYSLMRHGILEGLGHNKTNSISTPDLGVGRALEELQHVAPACAKPRGVCASRVLGL